MSDNGGHSYTEGMDEEHVPEPRTCDTCDQVTSECTCDKFIPCHLYPTCRHSKCDCYENYCMMSGN